MKTAHPLGLALLLVLALTACSSTNNATVAPTTGATSSASPTPTTTPAATAHPTAAHPTAAPSTAAPTTTRAQVTTSARPGRCVSSGLRASLGRGGAAAGTAYIALLLTNRSRVTCTLTGYPGVSFVAGTDAHQVGAPASRDRRFSATPVTLSPGATSHATIAVANFANYDQSACKPASATGYRIFPPGSTGSLLISAPQKVCSRPGVQSFQTSVVRTGTSLN